MNIAEKLAATYLRLNGFLLLPQFTVFQGSHHGHVDLIGLRAKGSFSGFGGEPFLLDEALFGAISQTVCPEPKSVFLGVIAEVRTNEEIDRPKAEQVRYVQEFLGGVPMAKVAFWGSNGPPICVNGFIQIGNTHAIEWVIRRLRSMQAMGGLTKSGSWTLSEEMLADIMVLDQMGAFHASTPRRPEEAA